MQRPIRTTLILALLVGIYFLMPYFFGIVTQRYTIQFLNNENITLGKVFGIRLGFTQYHRGWFHSDATLEVDRKNSAGDWQLLRNIPITIDHGPTFIADNHRLIGVGMISAMNVPIDDRSSFKINIKEVIRFNGERGTIVLVGDQSSPSINGVRIDSLVMNVNSNLKADHFVFNIVGKKLHIDDPQQSLSADVADINLNLKAQYLEDRHWQMTAGLQTNDDTISTGGNDPASNIAVHADLFGLNQLHFDTKDMAKLLGEVVKIKQASDAQQPVSPSAWMALFQQFLVQLIHDDTAVSLYGVSAKTPMGEVQLHYDITFPTLPESHDYFDVATRGVGQLNVVVPQWHYSFAEGRQLSLSNLHYLEKNNTVFSRHSNLSFGAFDVADSAAQSQAPIFYASGFLYQGDLQGSINNLSQLMNWKVAKICLSGQCVNSLGGELKLINMNYDAFRGIASATQQLVQFDPNAAGTVQAKWEGLAAAYAKLISSKTSVEFSNQMQTQKGLLQLHANISWPNFQKNDTADLLSTVMDQSVYKADLQIPAFYVDQFLDGQANAVSTEAPKPVTGVTPKPAEPSFEIQVADFLKYAVQQGYLKKVGDAYQATVSGKGAVFTVNGAAWKAPA